MSSRFFTYIAGNTGSWRISRIHALSGEGLESADRMDIRHDSIVDLPLGARWMLRGVSSNARYVTRQEQSDLAALQASLGRPEATCAALILISKSAQWWDLAQDVRRDILETQSAHIAIGFKYLPAIARRLHHSRDLGEPYDFVTWFEYAPAHEPDFEMLLSTLRATPEWGYVEREIDIRLRREAEKTTREKQ